MNGTKEKVKEAFKENQINELLLGKGKYQARNRYTPNMIDYEGIIKAIYELQREPEWEEIAYKFILWLNGISLDIVENIYVFAMYLYILRFDEYEKKCEIDVDNDSLCDRLSKAISIQKNALKSTESLPSIGVNGNVLERLKKFDDECFECTEKHIFIVDDTDSAEANQIIPIEEIADKVQRDILEGNKIPHSTSRLVIRQKGKELVFAVFVFFFSKEDIESGMVDRPTLWAEIDMRTGVISSRYDTHNNDFSSASYEEKYNVRTDKKYDTSRDYYKKAFELLDKVRLTYIESARFLEREYKEYMDMILANIPENYRQFYADLSI